MSNITGKFIWAKSIPLAPWILLNDYVSWTVTETQILLSCQKGRHIIKKKTMTIKWDDYHSLYNINFVLGTTNSFNIIGCDWSVLSYTQLKQYFIHPFVPSSSKMLLTDK